MYGSEKIGRFAAVSMYIPADIGRCLLVPDSIGLMAIGNTMLIAANSGYPDIGVSILTHKKSPAVTLDFFYYKTHAVTRRKSGRRGRMISEKIFQGYEAVDMAIIRCL